MTILTKEAILGAQDHKTEYVDVPEWGGIVRVKTMSGRERDAFEASLIGEKDSERRMENMRARMLAWCIVDENNRRMFSIDEADDLGQKSAAALDRVVAVARRINGMSKDESEKNSNARPGEEPYSASV